LYILLYIIVYIIVYYCIYNNIYIIDLFISYRWWHGGSRPSWLQLLNRKFTIYPESNISMKLCRLTNLRSQRILRNTIWRYNNRMYSNISNFEYIKFCSSVIRYFFFADKWFEILSTGSNFIVTINIYVTRR